MRSYGAHDAADRWHSVWKNTQRIAVYLIYDYEWVCFVLHLSETSKVKTSCTLIFQFIFLIRWNARLCMFVGVKLGYYSPSFKISAAVSFLVRMCSRSVDARSGVSAQGRARSVTGFPLTTTSPLLLPNPRFRHYGRLQGRVTVNVALFVGNERMCV